MKIHWLILCSLLFTFQDNAFADLRKEINSRESREDELFKKCNANLYRTNFQNGIVVANNTVYRSTKTCENGGIEGFEQLAPLDQVIKVNSSREFPACRIYHQWSITQKYPHSPQQTLQHFVKRINCPTEVGIGNGTDVKSEHLSIKWFCFDGLLGTRECQERIN